MTEQRGQHDEEAVCLCVSEHRPACLELERHHIWPLGMGGPDSDWNKVWLCSTAHTNVHELMRFMLNGKITDFNSATTVEERPVNRYAYSIAVEGIRRWQTGGANTPAERLLVGFFS